MTNFHVLLADDDASITKGLSDILRGHFPGQFTLHCASSGTELKHLLCTVPAALVITDIKMPGMTGLDCLRFVREQNLSCEVVLLSGYDDYALIRRVYQLMERIPAMIHIIADNKLTHYDAVSSIKNLPTLSQLRDRLIETFLHNLDMLKRSTEKREQYLIAQAKEYIAHHYMENPTLEDVAGQLHLNPSYFSTLFKQLSGVTFRDYLRTERIEAAKRLIRQGDCKLYEVAELVGYQNASHFNRAFKEVTGVSPSVWALHHKHEKP